MRLVINPAVDIMKGSNSNISSLFVILAAVLWGIDGIALRPELYTIPVALVVLIESAVVTLILTPFLKKRFVNLKLLDRKDWISFIGVAVFGGAIGTMAITKALFYVHFVNLSIVIFIQKLQPLFALLLARIILKEELPRVFFIWAAAAIFGAYLMTFGVDIPNLGTGKYTLYAAGFALLASASYGSSTVLSKRALKNISFELGTYLRFTITTVIMIIIALSLGDLHSVADINLSQWTIFLIIAISTGGPAIFLYYYGLKNISASKSTIFELAFPLTAALLEYVLHGNILTAAQWFGVALLMYAMIMITKIKPINA